MVSTVPPSCLSASKRRRLREQLSKQKLYNTLHSEVSLTTIQTQLAILTSAFDSLASYLMSNLTGTPLMPSHTQLNRNAAVFTPCYASIPTSQLNPTSGPPECGASQNMESTGRSKPSQVLSSCADVESNEASPEELKGSPGLGEGFHWHNRAFCNGCWEALPQAYVCDVGHFCVPCASYHNQADDLSSPFQEALKQLKAGAVQSIHFYDTCKTMVASMRDGRPDLVARVPSNALAALLVTARGQHTSVASHFGKAFSPAANLTVEDSTAGNDSACQESSKDAPEYSSEQVHSMIQETILLLIEQLRESPRWQGAAVDEIKRIAAEHKSVYMLGDGRMYSKAHVKELSVRICSSLIDAFISPAADDHQAHE